MLQKAKDFMSDFESKSFGREDVVSMLYLFGSKIKKEQEEEIEDWKACHEHQLELMKGLNNRIVDLKEQIEKMKADVKQGQSYWNSGEMQYDLYQRLLDKWEIKEND